MTESATDVRSGQISAGDWSAWERARKEIQEAVAEAKEIASRVGAEADFSALDKATRSLRDHAFRIGVIGDFSNGKSTLINAMIGAELLPTGVLPLTARPTEIRYGSPFRIILETVDGEVEVGYEEFQERNKKLRAAEEAGEPIDPAVDYLRAIIEVDRPLLRSGLVFVDVPGHNSGFSAHEAIADDAMRSCDALIAVLHADTALRKVESDRLQTALLDLEHQSVFVAVNKLDTLRPEQQEELIAGFPRRWERFLESLDLSAEISGPLRHRVYLIDSFNTLQSRLGRGERDVGVAEFARLEQDLAALADGDLIAEKLDRPRRVLLRQLAALRQTIADQSTLLDADAAELARHKKAIDASVDRLEAIAAQVRDVCERAGIRRMYRSEVRLLAEEYFTECLRRLPAWAKEGREGRPLPGEGRFSRLRPQQVRARIELIAGELLERLRKETLHFSERAVRPRIEAALRDTHARVLPHLEAFQEEVRRMWREVLSGTDARPPAIEIVDTAMGVLVDDIGRLPLPIRSAGVLTLVMQEVTQRIKGIFRWLRTDAAGLPDELKVAQAAWQLQAEISAGLQRLASVLIGTDAEVREALDELLERYACRAVSMALTDESGKVTVPADLYADNADRIVKHRQDALLEYLHEQTGRVRSLYDGAVRTVQAGLEKVRAEKAALAEAAWRLSGLAAAIEGVR